MDPVFDLSIRLPPAGSRHRLRDLHLQLKAAILDGRLQPGLRLPATRAMAAMLDVSRNTAVAAYDLLLSEGYLEGRPGAGTFVAEALPQPPRSRASLGDVGADHRLNPFWRGERAPAAARERGAECFSFRIGLPDSTTFPFHIWRRLSARALRALARVPAAYGEPEGREALRAAIARHVSFTRAVACRPEDVLVTAGAQQAFDLLSRTLVTPGRTVVAVEDPGYPPLRAALAAAGAKIVGVPVDAEGLRVDRLPSRAGIVCVTPSHQYPLGVALSSARRAALLDFARRHDAVVIEDDYDSEFRFGGRPLDALQTLDRAESVFYVGTFSKSLHPALRLGFVVTPPWARAALLAAKRLADGHTPVLEQDTLAAFIGEGHLARHVRRMRAVYAERRSALAAALERHCTGRLEVIPGAAGLHLAAWLDPPLPADALAARCAEAGIALGTLGQYALGPIARDGLALGYGLIGAGRIDEAIGRLGEELRRLPR